MKKKVNYAYLTSSGPGFKVNIGDISSKRTTNLILTKKNDIVLDSKMDKIELLNLLLCCYWFCYK